MAVFASVSQYCLLAYLLEILLLNLNLVCYDSAFGSPPDREFQTNNVS